ncbi:MAG: hypothetical protein ACRCW9_03180 [Cetobacterium sp.]
MINSNKILNIDRPHETKILINYSDREFIEVDLVQLANLEISETKKPVFGFEQRNFHSVLSGKRMATGTLVIKKSSQETIINTIYAATDEKLDEAIKSSVLSKVDTIYELLDNKLDQIRMMTAGEKINEVTEEFLEQQRAKFAPELLIEEINNRVSKIKNMKQKNFADLLSLGHDNPISIKIQNDSGDIIISDVHFLSKNTSVDINQEDIDDVYSFIGNIKELGDN